MAAIDPLQVFGDGAEGSGFADDVAGFRWRDIAPEDWASIAILWVTCALVFAQVFSRYVLNDSVAWTEEISIYLLTVLCFVGSAMAVRRNSHIHIELLFSFLPARLAWALSTVIDLARIVMLAVATWLTWQVTDLMGFQNMVSVDVSLRWVYGPVTLGCAVMTLRAVQVAIRHQRQGWSALTRPGVDPAPAL